MPRGIKMVIIGAGSAQFSLGLVRDLCLADGLSGSTVTFVDIDPERLAMVHTLATRYAAELGADLRFEQTGEREAALAGADTVVNTALAGGHNVEEDERAVLDRHGYYRGIHPSEGFYRQFALMLEIAQDVERICPDAWLLQVSNPVYDGCTLMTRATKVKVVGLCHGPFGGITEIGDVLGLDPRKLTFEAPGVNHCVWMTHFRFDGADAYPLLDRWIAEEADAYWREPRPRFSRTQLSPAAIDMYRFYGLLPLGDTSRAIWPEAWWYHLDIATKRRWWGEPYGGFDSDEGWAAYLQTLAKGVERMREAAADPEARLTELFPPRPSGEQIVPLVDALINDRRGDFVVNVPNNGALKGLPDDVVVEVPAVADGKGIKPRVVGRLPETVMLGAIYPQWLAMERRLAGFRSGDPRFLLQVLLADNRTRTREQAEETLAAMLAMPGNEAMAAHFAPTREMVTV